MFKISAVLLKDPEYISYLVQIEALLYMRKNNVYISKETVKEVAINSVKELWELNIEDVNTNNFIKIINKNLDEAATFNICRRKLSV